ncbi:SEC-C metal-binding domain-containing protein [Shouchella shacheensis]|uniref:SEC-C metal-binding domain-containing protein n=1 Tax=Shouchella shacheensis TaxID=1649580 RepID=UPI0007405718|nr:SEC-C metal-binding domain-containing protein [Shouchella shacheensis]
MRKRNDPCSCGSGKKYKKCCMTNVSNVNHALKDELNQLKSEMLYMAFTRYKEELSTWIRSYHHVYPDAREEVTETISSMLLVWLIFTKPIGDDEKTIFDLFLDSKLGKLKRPRTIEIVESWRETTPALLKAKHVNGSVCTSEHIHSQETLTHTIPAEHIETVQPGSLIIGFPAQSDYYMSFIGPIISFSPEKTVELMQKIEAFQAHSRSLSTKQWPQLLSSLLDESEQAELDLDSFNWKDDKEKKTAQLLMDGLRVDQTPPELISLALQEWHRFCEQKTPAIRKPEVFAAALEYYLQTIAPVQATQKALAKKYGVSTSTISTRSTEIQTALQKEAVLQG